MSYIHTFLLGLTLGKYDYGYLDTKKAIWHFEICICIADNHRNNYLHACFGYKGGKVTHHIKKYLDRNFLIFFKEDTSNPKFKDNLTDDKYSVIFWWCIGIGILTVALLISACMGIYQEILYKKYGKRSREALYYTVTILIRNISRLCFVNL